MTPSPNSSPEPNPAPRKRKITARVRDNADPLLLKNKKARIQAKQNAIKPTLKTNRPKARSVATRPPTRPSIAVETDGDAAGLPSLHPMELDSIEQAVTDTIDVDKEGETEISDTEHELEAPEESCEAELSKKRPRKVYPSQEPYMPHIERLSKEWTAPIYAFFHATPVVLYINEHRLHAFQCIAKHCRAKNGRDVRRYLDTSDRRSTSNLRKHAKVCWGDDQVDAADQTKDVAVARRAIDVSKLKDGSLTASFKRVGQGKVTYTHRQRNPTEARCVDTKLFDSSALADL